ncbi:MAG TPA: hypothetical protein VHM16_03345 [Rubrobacteraceae bacterium]|nr:hypothetical protein [Rubrobacteraceae bacterium]
MKRTSKWALPILLLIEGGLIWSGRLDVNDAVIVVAVIEALLVVAVVGEVLLIARRYRRGRSEGLDFWMALEDGLAAIMPRQLARIAVMEPRLFTCLARWVLRRVRPAEDEFAYHKRSPLGYIVLMVLMTAPVEVLIVEILLPWAWLRWTLLLLSVYASFWLLGFHASLATLPHRLENGGVRLRYGLFAGIFIPYAEISGVECAARKAPKPGDGLQTAPNGGTAYLAINGKTNFTLRLREPRRVRGFFKDTKPATIIHLSADDPERFLHTLRQAIDAQIKTVGTRVL